MDKPAAKQAFVAAGLPCPVGIVVPREVLVRGDVMPRPYVVKPPAEGSSVGVRIVRDQDNAQPFDDANWPFGDECWSSASSRAARSPSRCSARRPARARSARSRSGRTAGSTTTTAKYTDGQAVHLMPAPIDPMIYDEALRIAETAAPRARLPRRVARRHCATTTPTGEPGQLYLLEVNTQPA